MKEILKNYLPLKLQKFLWALFCLVRFQPWPKVEKNAYSGDFKSWQDAEKLCQGYSAPNILDRVLVSTLKVKSGEAVFERDGLLFDKPQYPWPLISSLLYAVSKSSGKINVVDFGGSLGSSFFQCRKFLLHLKQNLRWIVVEQPHFVKAGRKHIADDVLEFTETIEQALNANSTNILILGSVLQYLPSPRSLLEEHLKYNWDYVIVDRTPFLIGKAIDRLTIQSVPPSIYSAKYPAWFFNEKTFLNSFIYNYQMFAEWNSPDKYPIEGANTIFKGFFFQNVSNGKS